LGRKEELNILLGDVEGRRELVAGHVDLLVWLGLVWWVYRAFWACVLEEIFLKLKVIYTVSSSSNGPARHRGMLGHTEEIDDLPFAMRAD
jgi:hypothetical protein